MSSAPPTAVRVNRARLFYFVLAWCFFAVGVLGALLPLLPTTPFMLLALWSFSRSSQRFHDWLYNHRIFGAGLQNWHHERVVPWSVKITAYVSMLVSVLYTALIADFHPAIPAATALLCAIGVFFIARCPSKASAEPGQLGR
jgi:uncharacterized membrane protein YbaN (DUF454 family)